MGVVIQMKTTAIIFFVLIVGCPVRAQDDSLFAARRARLLDVVSREQEKSPYVIASKIHKGFEIDRAFVLLDSLTYDKGIGGMFYAYSLIGTYLYTQDALPDSLKQKVRLAYQNRMMYRGDTENHWVMYYTGLYLAAQTWPNDPGETWFNGKSSTENLREAGGWLNEWFRVSSTIGQGEFDSPTYFITFVTPMMALYEFAKDPIMKAKAQLMLDLLFVDFAAEHISGNYGGAHSRDYPEDIINPLGAPSTMWAWLYFGEPRFEQWEETRFRPRNRGGWEAVFGALSSYRLPQIIRNIATDRSEPYVHTETKRVRNVIRFGKEKNPPAYKYTYVTKDYVLGSLQGGILQPIQQHTWDVTVPTGRPNNTIFTLHPYYSGNELGMFFPEELKFLSDEVDRYHKVYTNPGKWNSSSPFEQTFQYRNTLLVLYKLEKGVMQPHIDGFFPKNLDERFVHSKGWMFCRLRDTYVGLYFIKPGEWTEESVNWRWRSPSVKNGVIVEVGSASEDESFQSFQNKVLSAKIDLKGFDKATSIRYVNRHGVEMRFSFDGPRILNGKQINLNDYQFFDGPFVQSKRQSGIITIRYKNQTRVLDFNKATIQESH